MQDLTELLKFVKSFKVYYGYPSKGIRYNGMCQDCTNLMLFADVMCKLQGNASHVTKHLTDNFYQQPSEGLHLPRSNLTSNRRHNQSHGLIQVMKAAMMD